MAEQFPAQHRTKTLCGHRGHFLTHERRAQAHNAEQQHYTAHLPNIGDISPTNTLIDDPRGYDWNNQLKDRFNQFKYRAKNHLFTIHF